MISHEWHYIRIAIDLRPPTQATFIIELLSQITFYVLGNNTYIPQTCNRTRLPMFDESRMLILLLAEIATVFVLDTGNDFIAYRTMWPYFFQCWHMTHGIK